jgi:hypothetical protein
MILWLLSCATAPYPDYFPDKSVYPQISGTTPEVLDSRSSGQELIIEGKHLTGARTVVVGGRNADIISIDDRAIAVRLPALPAGPSRLAVSVATGEGIGTLEDALTVDAGAGKWFDAEVASAALVHVDCPVTAWGKYIGGSWYPYEWCGPVAGWASAEGFVGAGSQPGAAGEISGVATLAQLPPVGEIRVYGPGDTRPPGVALVYGYHTVEERIDVQTERDFVRDLAFSAEREALYWDTYAWTGDVVEALGPTVVLFDDESCWIADAAVIEGQGDALLLDGDATGATGLHLGFRMLEDYYGEIWESDGMSTTAAIEVAEADLVIGAPSGAAMAYDDWSGWFLGEDVAGVFGMGELPGQTDYQVSTLDAAGVRAERGWVNSGPPLELHSPDLLSGDVGIKRDRDLLITWTPAAFTEDPGFLVIEISIFDTDVDDPSWQTEVARLVAQGDDSVGALTLPADVLSDLPPAPNNWGDDDDFTGYWGELTIARHRLRKVKVDGGDLVVDFIHAVNGPVRLR